MDIKKTALGCGVAAVVVFGVVSVLVFLVGIAGIFFLQSDSSGVEVARLDGGPVPVGVPYSEDVIMADGLSAVVWADPPQNCIGLTVEGVDGGSDGAACREDGPVVDEIVVGGQLWAVSLGEIGVALESTDNDCIEQHHATVNGFNADWCRLA